MNMSFIYLANQITLVIVPMIIIVGIIGNLLNIIVLTRSTLYQQACSRYFLANAVSNLFYSSIILLYRLLADQFQIDPTRYSIVWCKITVYITHVSIFLPPNFIVLASLDRWCASSINPQLRKFSNVKIARLMIIFTVIIFALFFINSAILADLQITDFFGCYIRANTSYEQIYVVIQACMLSLISPCLMAVFGLMTIYNIKIAHVQPIQISQNRRTGNELARMLLFQVVTHIILNMPSAITYLIFLLPNDIKITSSFYLASMLSVLPLHVSYVSTFFLYVLSGQIYRNELIRIGNRICRCGRIIQVHPLTVVNRAIPMTTRPLSKATRCK